MLSCARSLLASSMIEVVCECCDTGRDASIPFGPGLIYCLRPIDCLHYFASSRVCTEILYYDIVHVRFFSSVNKMNAVIASPHFVDFIACAVEVVEKMSVCVIRLLTEDKIDLETFSKYLLSWRIKCTYTIPELLQIIIVLVHITRHGFALRQLVR